MYSHSKAHSSSSAAKKIARHIPQVPERILDAPEIVNDYYLNLVDWSPNNVLAVALGPSVYLWNAGTGDIRHLLELDAASSEFVTSVKWLNSSSSDCCLAVGDSGGSVSLWDADGLKRVRTMQGHSDRVGCLAWNQVKGRRN